MKLSTLSEKGSAIGLSDCECIGVEINNTWTGQSICKTLEEIFSRSGAPADILKDQGSDLKLAVKKLKKLPSYKHIETIDDVGHVLAASLKSTFINNKQFKKFLEAVAISSKRLRHSTFAFLIPPKIRAKGRFQSIGELAKWGQVSCKS